MNRQEAVAIMPRRQRCAIYTRKSSEEGLDMEFNSLDAQREACEAFVTSQKAEGWATIRERYDDGGFSGGTLERPSLKRLIQDVEAGLIDVIVVYKIDRLSRSLMDFAKLVEIFDRNQVTFVSVTQSFNTTTSMGRLTLNILLSFAQFEREVIGERIRDKVAASRRRGMWMRAKNTRRQTPALLKGIIFTETGTAMTPTATKKGTRLYRYYASMDLIRNRPTGDASGPLRLPAGMVEDAVVGEIRRMIRAPEVAARTIKALRDENSTVEEKAVVKALGEFDQLWTALHPAEQTRIVQLLVERVTVGEDGIAVDLRHEGLGSVLRDMMAPRQTEACA